MGSESVDITKSVDQSPAPVERPYRTRILFGTVVGALLAFNAVSTLLSPFDFTNSSGGGTCGSMFRPVRYSPENGDHWLGWMWGSGEKVCELRLGAHQSEFWFSLLLMCVALGYVGFYRARQFGLANTSKSPTVLDVVRGRA